MCPVSLTDTVTLTYTATLENGELIDKSDDNSPLTLSIGSGTLCKAVEASLFGMAPGETRKVHVQPEDAFGMHEKDLIQEIPLAGFQGRIEPRPGMILALTVQRDGNDHRVPATVLSVGPKTVTVDYNHPLAGEVIIYTVTLIGINN